MEIKILNQNEIEKQSHLIKKSHILISVYSPSGKKAKLRKNPHRLSTLFVVFSDIDKLVNYSKDILFTELMAREILNFFEKFKDNIEMLIINCESGISRSAAIGAALMYIMEKDDKEIFKKYIPNRFVYRTILNEYYSNKYCKCKKNDEKLYFDSDKIKLIKRCSICKRNIK